MNILFASPESTGLIKTGGLGDVAASLPVALRALGLDVRLLIPGYREVLARTATRAPVARIEASAAYPDALVHAAEGPSGVPVYVIECAQLYERDAGPYVDDGGKDFADNAQRFGLLSYCAARMAGALISGWQPDLVQCNDWQTALAPLYARALSVSRAPFIQTVHNLGFQGLFPLDTAATLQLPAESTSVDGAEFFGRLSFLKAGLRYAHAISTVSPTYAHEIQREPLGFGLQDLLAARSDVLTGILNGIDVDEWDPLRDRFIARTFDADSLDTRAENRDALRDALRLAPDGDAAILGIVSRLTWQKGSDIVLDALPQLMHAGVQLAVLGSGEPALEARFRAAADAHPGRIAVRIGFDEALAHRIEAGADIFLMPSRFEPCGLNQMFSQRYGTPPVVRRTGGLADTVTDATAQTLASGDASGFVFDAESADALGEAVRRALATRRDPDAWRRVQRAGMRRDFSWDASARRYVELYTRTLRAFTPTA